MRIALIPLLVFAVTGCEAREEPPLLGWSLAPRDNVLARALEIPRPDAELRLRMIAAVEASQAVGGPTGSCDQVARPGCSYTIRWISARGSYATCERRTFTVEQQDGEIVLRENNSGKIDCPPVAER